MAKETLNHNYRELGSDVAPCSAFKNWSTRDLKCTWHPFTQAQIAAPPTAILQGKGSALYTETGEMLLDAISSWWVNLHGHGEPHIAQSIAEQALELEHVIFADYTHPQAIRLAERLLALFPSDFTRVFYSDNGSTAVEVALKMALQASSKRKLLSFNHSYHGDTFGAMSAAGKNHFNHPFWPYLFSVESISPPIPGMENESWESFKGAIASEEIAAFIFEPLIQGAGGMLRHSAQILSDMVALCQERGILTIADEVMTGFGRTGTLFASEQLTHFPDIICLSKGITGGFLPLGATVVKESLFNAFLSHDPQAAFLHGHSYTANPLACAAANASLDLLLSEKSQKNRKRISDRHKEFIQRYCDHPLLKRCEALGTILALEYHIEDSGYHTPFKNDLTAFFKKRAILIRPLGAVLYVMPPYCTTDEELETIYEAIEESLCTLFLTQTK